MSTETGPLLLRAGHILTRDFGRIALSGLMPNADRTAGIGADLLIVVDGQERTVQVPVGETFRIGEHTWRVDSIVDESEYSATVSRIS